MSTVWNIQKTSAKSEGSKQNAGKESDFRQNYTEDLDFSKEVKWGMDPLQACVLLQKVRTGKLQ